jgi:hypothetical protein
MPAVSTVAAAAIWVVARVEMETPMAAGGGWAMTMPE